MQVSTELILDSVNPLSHRLSRVLVDADPSLQLQRPYTTTRHPEIGMKRERRGWPVTMIPIQSLLR